MVADKNMEGWVGRLKSDSTEVSRKSITSHVARMTGGKGDNLCFLSHEISFFANLV